MQIFLISLGAILGAIARWQLSLWLNPLVSQFALGTLICNLTGSFLIGIAIGLSLDAPHKLLFITGFLGSFTTFSSLSAEVSEQLLQQKWLNAIATLSLHIIGGLSATLVGIFMVRLFK